MENLDEESISELPSEIIHSEILPRLPAKSLMRFKCVSKTWSSLFRNHSFVTAHRYFQHSPNNKRMTNFLMGVWNENGVHQHLLSVQINHEAEITSNEPSQAVARSLLKLSAPAQGDLYRVQRTNDLICLHFCYQSFQKGDRDYDCNRTIRVFNPSTRDSITIPHPYPPSGRIVKVSHHFGFCQVTNEYKILQIQRFFDERPRRTILFQIFTLATGSGTSGTSSWRALEVDDDHTLPLKLLNCEFERESVCVQGVLHWVNRARLTRTDELERTMLVTFDVKDERFRSIVLPSDCGDKEHPYYIIELNGCVGVVHKTYGERTVLKLRILKDYKNQEWVKETISYPVHWGYISPFLIHSGSDVVFLKAITMTKSLRVHLYNRKTKNFGTCEIILPESIIGDDSACALQAFTSYESCIVPLK